MPPSSRTSLSLLLLLVLTVSLFGASLACGPSCRTGYYYLERPSFNYSSNGCGSYGVSISAPFGANTCCFNHDYCYSNCSTTKTNCDSTFDTCLTAQCGSLNSTAERDTCKAQADLFYGAVMDLGCPAYDSAQDAACECSLSTNYSDNNSNNTYYLSGAEPAVASSAAHIAVLLLIVALSAVAMF